MKHSSFSLAAIFDFESDLFRFLGNVGVMLSNIFKGTTMVAVVQLFGSVMADGVD